MDRKKTALISLYSINRLVFTRVIVAECVYCTVRYMSLYIIRVKSGLKGKGSYRGNIYHSLLLNDYILREILIRNLNRHKYVSQ
jgi:hypothetical protein